MNILIADDHNIVLSGLQSLLQTEIIKVSTVNDYDKLLSILKEKTFDVLLLDIKFGQIDSREVLGQIKKANTTMKIIALTSLDDAESIKSTLAAGVNGYLIKSDDASEIMQAITEVLSGKKYISSTVKNKYLESELMGQKQSNIHLTPREKDILTLIIDEKTTREIAEILFLSEKTVENYRANMMAKLDVKNIAGLVKKTILDGLLSS